MSSPQDNKDLVRRFFEEIFNQGNLTVADELVAPDAIDHAPDLFPGQAPIGPERLTQLVAWYRAGFPDARWDLEGLLAERDKVVCRATFHGTHQGEFAGIPPTGNKVDVLEMRAFRIADGKIAESWGRAETFGMRHQLGVAPRIGPRIPSGGIEG